MNKTAIESKIAAFNAELERNITNRRRVVIAKELHRLSALLNESDKNDVSNLKKTYQLAIDNIKNGHEAENKAIEDKLNLMNQEVINLKKEQRLNRLAAQSIFKIMNTRLTPDEIRLFKEGLDFIRKFI